MKLDKNKLLIAMAEECLNAYEVSEKAGIKYPTLSKILRGGSCKPATVGKIAKALNVAVVDLLKERG